MVRSPEILGDRERDRKAAGSNAMARARGRKYRSGCKTHLEPQRCGDATRHEQRLPTSARSNAKDPQQTEGRTQDASLCYVFRRGSTPRFVPHKLRARGGAREIQSKCSMGSSCKCSIQLVIWRQNCNSIVSECGLLRPAIRRV